MGLANMTPEIVGRLFMLMIIVQISVPAVYNTVVNGNLTLKAGVGFAAAIIATVLLV